MSWTREPPVIFDGEDELQLKLQFAAIVARNPNARLTAGYQVFQGEDNYGRAMQAQAWLSDPLVQEEISRLRETSDAKDMLPDVSAVKLEILQAARSAIDDKDKAALYKLYLDSEGEIGRAGQANGNTVVAIQNVIHVPTRVQTPEDEAAFKERFRIQQTRLIADAKARPATIAA